jgi:serine/threonine-protein kinase
LEVLLGRGGVGEVWRARHVLLDSHVAIKFLHGPSADHAASRERFLTEAKVAAQLKTRYAVRVFDYGVTADGRPFLVMELLDGETLGSRLRRVGRLSPQLTVRFLGQAARALARAHSLRIVHRDFKPDNVLLVVEEEGPFESVKVLDFGVAKLVKDLASEPPPPLEERPEDALAAMLTRTGSLLGTPRYMAPEQIVGAPDLDRAADVWAFGVVAFECVTGEAPFSGKALTELFAKIQCGVHPRASALAPGVPEAFDAWFDVACATHPANRFASASLAAAELAAALGEPAGPSSERGSEPPSPPSPGGHSSRPPELTLDRVTVRADFESTPSMPLSAPPAPPPSPASLRAVPRIERPFRDPPWDAPLDVEACIARIPPGATMKGLFTSDLVAETLRRGHPLSVSRPRYLPFADYPLVEHARILVESAHAFFPDMSMRQALRRLGRRAHYSFLRSLVGKVLWARVDGVLDGLDVATRAYTLSSPTSQACLEETGPGRARVRLDGVHHFLDCHHIGVFEGVLRACGAEGTVCVREDRPGSGELLLEWKA